MPYLGYFQLVSAVDEFVLYDNIEYTKKGWINRNRFLQNALPKTFTVALKKDSDTLQISERQISDDFNAQKILNSLHGAYCRAPFYKNTITLIEDILTYNDYNLYNFLHHSINLVCKSLEIDTKLTTSSDLPIDHSLKSEKRVLEICDFLKAKTYINPIGGIGLYDPINFSDRDIELKFLKMQKLEYKQFNNPFVDALSILDVMMFNSKKDIIYMLKNKWEFVK